MCERSYQKVKLLPLKKDFTCRKLYNYELNKFPNNKTDISHAMKNLSNSGKKLIKVFINENDKREQKSRDEEERLYRYKHSKPPLQLNSWKFSNHVIEEFSRPKADEIHSFRGPGRFSKGIYKHLPFISDKCVFIFSSNINFMFKIDYYYVPHPKFKERQFEKLVKNKLINKYILGPIFVPKKWFSFPSKRDWKEERFPEILNASKGIAVHSNRVIAYLSQKSNTTDNLEKYKIVRACSNFEPKNVNSFKDRKIDIFIFHFMIQEQ